MESTKVFRDVLKTNMKTHDELTRNLYDYDKLTKGSEGSSSLDDKKKDEMLNLMTESRKLKSSLIDVMKNKNFVLGEQYDMYKNKELTKGLLDHRNKRLNRVKNSLHDDLSLEKRQIEISAYEYHRNKAFSKIFIYIMIYCIIVFSFYLFNRYVFTLKNSIYSTILLFITIFLFSFILLQLYDVQLRSEYVFDEYKHHGYDIEDLKRIEAKNEFDRLQFDYSLCPKEDTE